MIATTEEARIEERCDNHAGHARPTGARAARCPNRRCGSHAALEVIAGTFRAEGLRLVDGRLDFTHARTVATDDEIVRCLDCGGVFPVTQVLP